jgi:uncharacterized membrane protein YhiD involved in acid resistance
MNWRLRRAFPLLLWTLLVFGPLAAAPAAQAPPVDLKELQKTNPLDVPHNLMDEVRHAVIRLPLAALLGTLLAVRPKRKGTPPRQPAVIQTQIILAIVGAVVMLVVGSNLARAFGVVGAAGLVRYRAKVEDPKDAGVMLSTLAVGLASGVGQYVMAGFSTGFILVALWIIESFEPEGRKLFELKVKMGDDTDSRRKELDTLLSRYRLEYDLLSSSDEELCYEVWVPLEMPKERIANAILKLDPDGHASVEWNEKKTKTK